jgi:hypothetical protein
VEVHACCEDGSPPVCLSLRPFVGEVVSAARQLIWGGLVALTALRSMPLLPADTAATAGGCLQVGALLCAWCHYLEGRVVVHGGWRAGEQQHAVWFLGRLVLMSASMDSRAEWSSVRR